MVQGTGACLPACCLRHEQALPAEASVRALLSRDVCWRRPGCAAPVGRLCPSSVPPPASSGGCAQVSTLPTIYLRRLLWRFFLDTLSWFCIACCIACAIVFVVLGYCASEKGPFLSENALSLLRTPAHFIQHLCAFCMPPLLWECCIRWM